MGSTRRHDERGSHHPWSVLDMAEVWAALLSLFILVAALLVIILVDTWLGIALIALSLILYFVVSVLHIGRSRRRVADQLTAFERRKRNL